MRGPLDASLRSASCLTPFNLTSRTSTPSRTAYLRVIGLVNDMLRHAPAFLPIFVVVMTLSAHAQISGDCRTSGRL